MNDEIAIRIENFGGNGIYNNYSDEEYDEEEEDERIMEEEEVGNVNNDYNNVEEDGGNVNNDHGNGEEETNVNTPVTLTPKFKLEQKGPVLGLSISSDGKYLLCALRPFSDQEVVMIPTLLEPAKIEKEVELHLFNLETGKRLNVFRGGMAHTSEELPFLILGDVSPDNKHVACGTEDGILRIWHAEFGTLLTELADHTNVVNFVSWHPSSKYLISGSDDWSFNIYQTPEY